MIWLYAYFVCGLIGILGYRICDKDKLPVWCYLAGILGGVVTLVFFIGSYPLDWVIRFINIEI